jgi:hypothetical protein
MSRTIPVISATSFPFAKRKRSSVFLIIAICFQLLPYNQAAVPEPEKAFPVVP